MSTITSAPGLPTDWHIITVTGADGGSWGGTRHALAREVQILVCPGCGQRTGRDKELPALELNEDAIRVWQDVCPVCYAHWASAIPWAEVDDPDDEQAVRRASETVTAKLDDLGWLDDTVTHEPCSVCSTDVTVTHIDGAPHQTNSQGRIVCDSCAD